MAVVSCWWLNPLNTLCYSIFFAIVNCYSDFQLACWLAAIDSTVPARVAQDAYPAHNSTCLRTAGPTHLDCGSVRKPSLV